MQSTGRLPNHEWMLPAKLLSVALVFKQRQREETWRFQDGEKSRERQLALASTGWAAF